MKVDLIGCFRELHVRKFRKFSPDHFYDLKNRFYDKKKDFYEKKSGIRESRVRRRRPAISSETTGPRTIEPYGNNGTMGHGSKASCGVSVGSLEIPGFPSAHSRFPESSSHSRFPESSSHSRFPYPGFFS